MAAPLLTTNETTITKIKEIISRYKNWSELEKSEADKQAFLAIFLLNAGFFGSHYFEKPETAFNALTANIDNLDDFLAIKEPPLDQSTVDAALLAKLVAEMHADQEVIKEQIRTSHPKSTKETVEMVRRIWLLNQALVLRNQIKPELLQQLNETVNLTTPKETDRAQLRQSIAEEAENIAKFTINAVMDVTEVAPEKIGQATAIIATAAAIFPDYKDDQQTQKIVTDLVVKTVDPNYETDITKVVDQIRQATKTATASDYAAALTHPEAPLAVDTPNNTTTNFAEVVVPEKINTDSAETIIAKVKEVDYRYQERVTGITETTQTISEKFQNLSQSVVIAAALYPVLPDSVVNEIVHAAAGIIPDQIRIPTQAGGKFIGLVSELPANPHVNKAGAKLFARGINVQVFQQLVIRAQTDSQSAIGKVLNNPAIARQISETFTAIRNIQLSPVNESGVNLGREIHQPNVGFFQRYQNLTNRITNILPTRFSTPLNYIFHPTASIKSWVGQKTGQFIARQFVDRIGNVALRNAGQFLLEKGLTAGLKQIGAKVATQVAAKLGISAATKLGASLALRLAVGTAGGPVGWAVAIGSIVAQWLGEKLIKKPEEVVAITVGAVAAPAALISTLVAAVAGAIIVASHIAATMAIAAAVALFFYFTAFTAAPLISTLAQLQSGIGVQQGIGGPILPPYTGPILPGCPTAWPIPSGLVIQGPHGSYSHRFVEGIDILTSVGTPVTSLTDGTVTAAGWAASNPAYGNWIKIKSKTSGGQEYTIIYAHLSEVRVAENNAVQHGSVIGLSGNTSAVASFANPHLHLEYVGINYNSCPAGGVQIPDGCYGTNPSQSNSCTINGKPITF